MKHVLVTGGAGFIGSHVVDAYLARGWKVTIVDDLSTGSRANLNAHARFVEGDLGNAHTLDQLFAEPIDQVNHHAAQIDVRKSVADPAADAEQNIVASLRLFAKAAEHRVKKIIFASSGGAAYGEPQVVPQNEEHPFAPLSPYGIAKLSVEYYLRFFSDVHGISTAALRYGNVYGPRQSPHGEAGVIAIFAARMLAGEEVTINGEGNQTRDYIFIDDVVAANMAVAESDLAGAFNVGTGVETSVLTLASLLADAAGIPLRAHHAAPKAGEQRRSILDGTKLRRAASLPEPLALRDGLRRTLAAMR